MDNSNYSYFLKYLKYKNKYINLKIGGSSIPRKSSEENLDDSSSKLIRTSSSPILQMTQSGSYIDIASLDSEDIIIEDLKVEDIIELIRLCFLNVVKCDFLFHENVVGKLIIDYSQIIYEKIFEKGFDIFIKKYLQQIDSIEEQEEEFKNLIIENNIYPPNEIEYFYREFMSNMNEIYDSCYTEFYTIVTKNPESE